MDIRIFAMKMQKTLVNECFVNKYLFLKNTLLKLNIMKARKILELMAFPDFQNPMKLTKLHRLKFMPSKLLQIEKQQTFHWTYESLHMLNVEIMNFKQSVPKLNSRARSVPSRFLEQD